MAQTQDALVWECLHYLADEFGLDVTLARAGGQFQNRVSNK
jgi:hypothetical protein